MRKWDLRQTLLFYEDMPVCSHRMKASKLISHIVRGDHIPRVYLLILSNRPGDFMEIVECGHGLGWYPLTHQVARVIGITEGKEKAYRLMEEIVTDVFSPGKDLKAGYQDKVFLTSKEYKRRLRHGYTV
ncbi:hypothetical protein SAMN05216391_101153 [Lachnospiraceae bacterium KHCPX20]|jgi:hypothetical protein|nr:hypothetical protein SAMN05216391_101153 [Lachnospiraceae bacterium KHCPX20]